MINKNLIFVAMFDELMSCLSLVNVSPNKLNPSNQPQPYSPLISDDNLDFNSS